MTRVVRGLLAPDLLGRVLAAFGRATDWERMDGSNVYGPAHQQFSGRGMPADGEPYWMDFDRSNALVEDPAVIEAVGRVARRHGAVACYRMGAGQGLRVHRDDYFGGGLSATLYLSPWRWDWGGVLHVLSEDGAECSVVCPEENLCAYVDHVPHFVSRVEGWAARPRYTVNVFGILEI